MSPALLRIWRAPAVQALLIQCLALPLTWAALQLAAGPSLGAAAIVQGVIAAALTAWRRLAVWWLPIQLLFPVVLGAALLLHLPNWLFGAAFLVLLCVYWSTFRTQVPYYPSGKRVWDAVAGLLPARPVMMIDIGSGLGGFALDLAARRPDATVVGIELAPLPWLVSAARARFSRSRARFVRGDYEHLDLGQYDAVFAYLSPAAMGALWRKAQAEMQPGSMLLSYEFAIADQPPGLSIVPAPGGPALYVWFF